MVARAGARVARHYPALSRISDKAVDHANFATVLIGVYGVRLLAYRMRKAQEKAERRAGNARPVDATVHPFPHNPSHGG